MPWINADGLLVKFGTEEGQTTSNGEYRTTGPLRMVEYTLDLTTLGSSATVISYHSLIEKNARIEKVEIEVFTAATSGGSATLNIGVKKTDYSTDVGTADVGLVSALALSNINTAGQLVTLTAGSSGAGGLIGTTPGQVGVLTVKYGTAAFTAGRIAVRVYWSNPT